MSTTLGNRIHVRGPYEYDEHVANDATVKPGHLIEVLSTGKIQKQSTAGGRCERRFAIEDALSGPSVFRGSSGLTVASTYAAADLVPNIVGQRGTIVNAYLKAGVSYAVGDRVVAAGDGTLEKESSLASSGLEKDCIAVVVDAALDLSGSGAVATLHPVQLI